PPGQPTRKLGTNCETTKSSDACTEQPQLGRTTDGLVLPMTRMFITAGIGQLGKLLALVIVATLSCRVQPATGAPVIVRTGLEGSGQTEPIATACAVSDPESTRAAIKLRVRIWQSLPCL